MKNVFERDESDNGDAIVHETAWQTFLNGRLWALRIKLLDYGPELGAERFCITVADEDTELLASGTITENQYFELRNLTLRDDVPRPRGPGYTLTVRFDRDRALDLDEAIANFPSLETEDDKCLAQFFYELQRGYEDGYATGSWNFSDSTLTLSRPASEIMALVHEKLAPRALPPTTKAGEPHVYRLEAGRLVLRDGVSFFTIHRHLDASPTEVDNAARRIVALLNEDTSVPRVSDAIDPLPLMREAVRYLAQDRPDWAPSVEYPGFVCLRVAKHRTFDIGASEKPGNWSGECKNHAEDEQGVVPLEESFGFTYTGTDPLGLAQSIRIEVERFGY